MDVTRIDRLLTGVNTGEISGDRGSKVDIAGAPVSPRISVIRLLDFRLG